MQCLLHLAVKCSVFGTNYRMVSAPYTAINVQCMGFEVLTEVLLKDQVLLDVIV